MLNKARHYINKPIVNANKRGKIKAIFHLKMTLTNLTLLEHFDYFNN